MNKKLLSLMLAVLIALVLPAWSLAEDEADSAVEENVIYVHGFGPIHKLDYLIRHGEGDLVILGVDAGWIPKQSIVYQEAL